MNAARAVPLALIGAGSMAANHARVIAEHPRTTLSVVIDRDPGRARALAERHGCGWATHLDDLRGAAAAVVASSTESHPEVAATLLSMDLPLLVEKPLAADVTAAQ